MKCKIKHSESKSAWNVVGTMSGGRYKLARFPYSSCADNELTRQESRRAKANAELFANAFHKDKEEKQELSNKFGYFYEDDA